MTTSTDLIMWEILVPTMRRVEGTPIRKRCHKVWDAKVRAITGGLTIMPPAKGQWVCPEGQLFEERMIPVRILATHEQMDQIIDMTMIYYDQLAILAYEIGRAILRHRKPVR